jgi:hypothetical protein
MRCQHPPGASAPTGCPPMGDCWLSCPMKIPSNWKTGSSSGSRTCSPATPSSVTWSATRRGWPTGSDRLLGRRRSARRLKKVRDLGRKLLYIAGPGTDSSPGPPWDDEPAVFVRGLEESAEGCHWLLERWAEFRNLLDRKAGWSWPEMFRFIRLQGKHSIEAVYDPALNSIFLAWEVLFPKSGHGFWNPCKNRMASDDPAHNSLLVWREIAPRPRDKTEALAVLSSVVDQHIGRLEELLAKYEEIEEEEAAERCDRAALDSSPAFEGHRRYQSTQTRELLRTLDTLRRMRNAECGTGNGEGEMADDKWGGFAGSEPGQLRGVEPSAKN